MSEESDNYYECEGKPLSRVFMTAFVRQVGEDRFAIDGKSQMYFVCCCAGCAMAMRWEEARQLAADNLIVTNQTAHAPFYKAPKVGRITGVVAKGPLEGKMADMLKAETRARMKEQGLLPPDFGD